MTAAQNGSSIFPLIFPTTPIVPEFAQDNYVQMLELVASQAAPASGASLTSATIFGSLTLNDGVPINVGSGTGSIIGQASSKLGFFGATAVVQPVASAELFAALAALGFLPAGTHQITMADGANIAAGSGTGTQIGGASAKLGFYGATPVIQPVASAELFAALNALGILPTGVHNVTLTDGAAVGVGSASGSVIGTASSKIGFYGAAAASQVAYASTPAAATTAVATGAIYGFATAAQGNAVVALVNALRAGNVTLGLGSN